MEFPWDKHVEPLRPELQQLWQQVADGTRVTDYKKFLDPLPVFAALPEKASHNNHLKDSNKFF